MTNILLELQVRLATTGCGRRDRGASLIEYALLVGLIAIVCFVAVGFLGGETSSSIDGVGSSFSSP